MPEMVIDLLACWRGQVGTRSVLAVWIIAPLCKNILVKSLFNWTGAFNISSSSHFSFYGVLSFFSSLVRPYLCIHNVY